MGGMSDEKSPGWLPAGWTVELKVRKSGRKDKCYTDPSNERTFNSKPEVLRYLKKEQEVSLPKSKEKSEGTTNSFAVNVVVQKTAAEELPPGWIKDLRIRKKGRKIRKDPYYTDPVTGYVFRSLKEVHRYLKTGELGRLAFKPKHNGCTDMELEDDKLPSHTGAEGHKLADSGTCGQKIGNQSSKLVYTVKDEPVLESTCTADPICISETAPEQ